MKSLTNIAANLADWARRFHVHNVRRAWPFVLFVLLLTWLMGFSIGEIPEQIHQGAIAPYDIRADRQYVIVNEEATEARRAEALAKARLVYDFDADMGKTVATRLREAFGEVRASFVDVDFGAAGTRTPEFLQQMRDRFESIAALKLSDEQWNALVESGWGEAVQEGIIEPVASLLNAPVVANVEQLEREQDFGITLRTITGQGAEPIITEENWSAEQIEQVQSIDQIRQRVHLPAEFSHVPALKALALSLLQPNCTHNLVETEARRARLLQGVTPVTDIIQAGELIARRYEPYSARQARLLKAIQKQKVAGAVPWQTVGYALFIVTILLLLHLIAQSHIRKYRPRRVDLYFLGALLLVMMVILRAGGFMSEALSQGLPLPIPRSAFYYLIPIATGGMMVRLLLNAETAVVFVLAVAAFAGILYPHDPSFTAYVLVVNLVAIAAVANADKRSSLIRAGAVTGLVAIVAVAAIHLMRAGALSEELTATALGWHLILTFGGQLFAAFLVLALTPLAETVFGYTSDIKLLELANLNHPLLRELVIRAPGTYHHSHLVGILSEAAADAIGANTLLARVGAYYHDVGKLRKPTYFTENQKGTSPHDRLSPHMSALIIASHVKEGIELARTYKLPQSIIDMIPQHHGTKRISYFYEQAKKQAGPETGEVDEKAFRYPGPKPQTREAGVLLLADGIEGAVRALKEKSPARIQQTVENLINKSFAEGQLNECELTLRNLTDIGNAFTRILLGIYHQRIEYPREATQLGEKDISVLEGEDTTADGNISPERRGPRPVSTTK